MSELSPTLGVLGDESHPYAGRIWVRRFPYGDYEVLYVSMTDKPSEADKLNAWFEDSGSDNRVTMASFGSSSWIEHIDEETGEVLETVPKETNQERAARRARQRIRWAAKVIGADRLLTLTFRDEITDYAQADKIAGKFLAQCRRQWSHFQFVMVPEIQETRFAQTGAAVWHFHLAVRGFYDFHLLRGFWWRACGCKVRFDEGRPVLLDRENTPGNIDVQRPKGARSDKWNVGGLAGYLSKYIGKAMEQHREFTRPRYRLTRGLAPSLERFAVRALDLPDVLAQFYPLASPPGCVGRSSFFRSPDGKVLWGSGSCKPSSSTRSSKPSIRPAQRKKP